MILLTHPLPDRGTQERLEASFKTRICSPTRGEEFALLLEQSGCLVARGPAKIVNSYLARADRLLGIVALGAGYDFVDLDFATARGILISNGSGVAPQPVAEYVIAMVILARRQLLLDLDSWTTKVFR
jgi:lactate dehydrogenase-like 2-hydroxyacid dehydrogenase